MLTPCWVVYPPFSLLGHSAFLNELRDEGRCYRIIFLKHACWLCCQGEILGSWMVCSRWFFFYQLFSFTDHFSWSCPRWTGPPETDSALNTDKLCAPPGTSQSPRVPASPSPTTCGHSLVCDHRASSECPGFQWWFSPGSGSLFLCLSWKNTEAWWKMKLSSWMGMGATKQAVPRSPEAPRASWTRLHPGNWA